MRIVQPADLSVPAFFQLPLKKIRLAGFTKLDRASRSVTVDVAVVYRIPEPAFNPLVLHFMMQTQCGRCCTAIRKRIEVIDLHAIKQLLDSIPHAAWSATCSQASPGGLVARTALGPCGTIVRSAHEPDASSKPAVHAQLPGGGTVR